MMTDRELLELAAKAAGIVGKWERDKAYVQDRYYFNVPYDNHNMLTGFEWNPLTDDGDALRLAVKLGIFSDTGMTFQFMESVGDSAATRRAIVRAAAEIGEAMP